MPAQNISIIQGETKSFEFDHQAADVNNRVWFTMYNGRDPVIYKESEKYGGSPDQIEIVATGDKKYIVKIKGSESEKLWLSDVTYKLYWINNQTEEMELLYWGTVNVSPQQQQEQRPKLLGYKYIQVWDQLPDPEDFEEGDIIIINGQLKTKKNSVWENIKITTKISVMEIEFDKGDWFFTYIVNEIGLGDPEPVINEPAVSIPTTIDARRIIVQCTDKYDNVAEEILSFGVEYNGLKAIKLLCKTIRDNFSILVSFILI